MRELYELVLKTVKEADKPIFKRGLLYLSNNLYNIDDPFEENSFHKYLNFALEFEDGDPKIEIIYKYTIKTEEYRKYFWSKKKKRTKSKDKLYEIKAGKLEYQTTIIEAKVLDKVVQDLLDKLEKTQKEKETKIILSRLEGNVKVVSKTEYKNLKDE